ncbi:MAG: hypothetical protein AB7V43_19040 [Acidimicrobiia bacterium]
MTAARQLAAVALLGASLAGCAGGANPRSQRDPAASTSVARHADAGRANSGSATGGMVAAPSLAQARSIASGWVASTGDLLKMGPIARSELVRQRVAQASVAAMVTNLDVDLEKLANGLPVPATELRLVETPITIDVSNDPITGEVRVQVWSVVVFGAKDLGAPRLVFRTSQLVLVVEVGQWKLASFTASEGPTPVATDALPSSWDRFAVVAQWQPATAGER